ncbi:hypothetical protein [Stappia sp. MMSF_3263]|nr:hypothetical protein [Stappia sp. MMSF_3263]
MTYLDISRLDPMNLTAAEINCLTRRGRRQRAEALRAMLRRVFAR